MYNLLINKYLKDKNTKFSFKNVKSETNIFVRLLLSVTVNKITYMVDG